MIGSMAMPTPEPDIATRPAAHAAAKRGVYFLANDRVIDLAIAFLNSFRSSNPFVPLCLIPHGDDTARLEPLAAEYEFTIYDNADSLLRCDALSVRIHGRRYGQYRKLCAFDGPFDEFVYIDADTIVLHDVTFMFQFLAGYDFVFSHSNIPDLRRWVWRDSIHDTGALTPAQIEFSANTGFLCARNGGLTIDGAERALDQAMHLVPHMELFCIEQPFLNYLVVTSGRPYTSLRRLCESARWHDVPQERWAGGGWPARSRFQRRWLGPNILLVHWAGQWSATALDRRINRWLRRFGIEPSCPEVRRRMPYRSLWRHYRYLRQ